MVNGHRTEGQGGADHRRQPHTANCIGPGTIDVERDAFQKSKPLRPTQPIRRLGKPQEVVSLMLYLASEDAGFITGQCYLVNGGMYFQ
ncbi:MAG: SDR family oxidoreductase [Burkholderiales bacterium]